MRARSGWNGLMAPPPSGPGRTSTAGRLIAALTAVVLTGALTVVAVVQLTSPQVPPVAQQVWGSPANRPHVVPASHAMAEVVNGRLVRYTETRGRGLDGSASTGEPDAGSGISAAQGPALPTRLPPKGAVPPAHAPARPKVKVHYAASTLRVLPRPKAKPVLGFNPTTSHQLTSLSTADRIVYANADGTRTALLFQDPVNYRLPDGSWALINTTLVPAGGSSETSPEPSAPDSATPQLSVPRSPSTMPPEYATASPSVSASASLSASASASPSATASEPPSPLPSASASPSPVTSPSTGAAQGWVVKAAAEQERFAPYADAAELVTMPLGGSMSVGFGVEGAAHVAGAAQGDEVTYPGALPASDLRYEAGAAMVTEDLVLQSRSAPLSYVFPLTLSGVSASTGDDGTIDFTDATGKVVAVVPPAYMTDSNINPHSGDGAQSDAVSYSLTMVNGRPAIDMRLDGAWLDSKARVFPVTVDPSIQNTEALNSNFNTYVQSGDPGNNSSSTELSVGTYDSGTNVAESYIRFDNVSTQLANDNVLSATLGLFNSWSYSCSPRTMYVYPVTQSWSTSSPPTTYPGPSTGQAVGRATFATGWVPLGSTVSPCPAQWVGIPLDQQGTGLVYGWTHGASNNGLALGASASDSYGWKKFTSINNPTGDPFLKVTYTTDGASYKLASTRPVTPVTSSQNGQIKVTITNTGSSTWTSSNGYELGYEVETTSGTVISKPPADPFTAIPSGTTVGPGGKVTLDATIDKLPVGTYVLSFDMYSGANGSSPVSFSSEYVTPLLVGLVVVDPADVIKYAYPPSGYVSATTSPQLSIADAPPPGSGTLTYQFSMTCEPIPDTTCGAGTFSSGCISTPYWTVSPPLQWNEPYTWTATAYSGASSGSDSNCSASETQSQVSGASITPEVPQPVTASALGGSSGQAFDPLSGDYTTSATDATISVAGPPLQITRVYNSLNTTASGAFGAGWSSVADMSVTPDNDGTGDVVVTMADGSQARFGYDSAASADYIAPEGSPDRLVQNSNGTWTLLDGQGNEYSFTSAGAISDITNAEGLSQTFVTSGGNTVITDVASGRTLTLTWGSVSGASFPHVVAVTTNAPQSGQPGLQWTYNYSGDTLTSVCAPTGECTSYTYGTTMSHYVTSVLQSGPRSLYEFGDASGTVATDSVAANLGVTDGTYTNVTLGGQGPLTGSSQTSASFNGTSSYVTLAPNLAVDSTYLTVGLWFKASAGSTGVLFGYQPGTMAAGYTSRHEAALYIGTGGILYGEFYNDKVDPIKTSSSVTNGQWQYAVLTGSGNTQSLYLNGSLVGTQTGNIDQLNQDVDLAGAGFWSSNWPGVPSGSTAGYFSGSIADLEVYAQPLGSAAIAQQYKLAQATSPELTQVTMPSGRVYEQVSYDTTLDRVATYTDPQGGQWALQPPITSGTKSSTGLTASSDALGVVTNSVTVTDPAGDQEIYEYNASNGNQLVSYSPGAGLGARTFGYNEEGFLDSVTDEDLRTFTYTTDVYGNVLSSSYQDISTCGECTTYYSYYEDAGNPVDPRNGELTGVRDARSASSTVDTYLTSYAYNLAGELTSTTTPATPDFPSGRTTSYVYSGTGQAAYGGGDMPTGLLTSVTTPGGRVTKYQYYSDGDLAEVTTPSGLQTVYTYDGLGRPLASAQTGNGFSSLTTSYAYNPMGQPVTVVYPGVTDPLTGITHTLQDSYAYDADGNLTQLTQSDLTGGDPTRVTSYTYDDHGNVATVTDADGNTSAYNWDPSGNVTSYTDADGNQYDYTYNPYGEVTSVTLVTPSTAQGNPEAGTSQILDSYAYTPAGLLAAATDAMGRVTNYAYAPDQQLSAVTTTDPTSNTGRQTAYGYDYAGNLTSVTQYGLTGGLATASTETTYKVDAADRVTNMVFDPAQLNRTIAYTYNADDDVTSQTISDGSGSTQTSYTYDSAGDRTSQAVQDGSTSLETTWTYNQLGQELTQVSPDGNVTGGTPANYTTSYGYDQADNLISVTGPPTAVQTYAAQAPVTERPVTQYAYDTYGDQVKSQDPDDNQTTATYDGDGNVTSVTQPSYTPPGTSSAITATTQYGYDALGNLTSMTDPRGNTTSYAYNSLGEVISQTDPELTGQSAPGTWTYAYDAGGELTCATDPTGAVTQATYDYFGDQATATAAASSCTGTGNTTSYSYNYLGEVAQATSPDGALTTNTYDQGGELTSTANSLGDTTSYAYNRLGEVTSIDNPDQTSITNTYDAAGNLTATDDWGVPPPAPQTAPLASSQLYTYDADGNVTSATDGRGYVTKYAYNPAGQVMSSTQPVSPTASITTSYGYDAAGNQTSYTDGNGNTTWTTYNSWNLPESVIEPTTPTYPTAADSTWTTSYNADGQPASLTEPGGATVTDSYDQMGDLSEQTGAGASATTPTRTFGYDLDGRMTSAATPAGTDTFTYNNASELTAATGPSGNSSFTYNGDGLLTSETDTAGTTSYTYNQADQLATETEPATGAVLSYGYNADGQPTSIAATSGSTKGDTQTLTYTGLHQVASDTLATASGTTIASESYAYDFDGDLTSATTSGLPAPGTTTYTYDEADRLISATAGGTTTAYAYDNDDNLIKDGSLTYTYNARDELTSYQLGDYTPATNTYSANGALTSSTGGDGTFPYTADAYGEFTDNGVQINTYDALGRTITDSGLGGSHSLSYVGTSTQIASDGASTYSYTPSGSLTGVGVQGGTTSQGTLAYTDSHTDLTGTYAPTAASLTGSASYDPIGNATTAGTMPDIGYQSDFTDPTTTMVDMNSRWYWPATSTFTDNDTNSGEPLTGGISPSAYAYTDGNPVTETDPTGHCTGRGSNWCQAVCALTDEIFCIFYNTLWANDGGLAGGCGGNSGTLCTPMTTPAEGPSGPTPPSPPWPSDIPTDCNAACLAGIGMIGAILACIANPEACLSVLGPVYIPPPPPPQDVYAGPDPQDAPKAPRSLRTKTWVNPDPAVEGPGDNPFGPDDIIDEEHFLDPDRVTSDATGDQASPADTSGGNDTGQTNEPTSQVDQPQSPQPNQPDVTTPESPATPESPSASGTGTTPSTPDTATDTGGGKVTLTPLQRILVGGGVGGALNVATALGQGHDNPSQLAKDFGIGFVTGAATGFVSGLGAGSAAGTRLLFTAGSGAAAGFGNSLTQQLLSGKAVNLPNLFASTAIGGLTSGLGLLGPEDNEWYQTAISSGSSAVSTAGCYLLDKFSGRDIC